MTSFPVGFIIHLGGVVSAKSVKLLDKIHNPGMSDIFTGFTASSEVKCQEHDFHSVWEILGLLSVIQSQLNLVW